jgi:tripartite-type tricarboxylate transporter receptor subunit TctC
MYIHRTGRRRAFGILAAAVLSLGVAGTAQAADYPQGPITIVVPFPPGGPTDTTARMVAKSLGKQLGQPVVVENRGGAGGTVGSALVARSKPDGYTLLWASTSSLGVAPGLYRNPGYSPISSFEHIGLVARTPILLVVRKNFPADTLKDTVAYAANHRVAFGSAGNGSINHLTGEWLKEVTGADMLHVPYNGGAPALTDMISGQIDMTLEVITVVRPYVEAGKAKILATGGAQRSPDMPDVPTVRELYGHDFESYSWTGLVAPAKTPPAVVSKLNAALRAAQDDPEVIQLMKTGGQEVLKTTPAEFKTFVANDSKRWAELIKRTHTSVD